MIDYTKGLDVGAMILERITLDALSNEDLVCLYNNTEFTANGYLQLMEEVNYRLVNGGRT